MTLKELIDFIKTIPEEMNDFTVVNGEVGYLDPNDDNSMVYRVDNPIITIYVDKHNKEFCFIFTY